jgi:hypothetical protein
MEFFLSVSLAPRRQAGERGGNLPKQKESSFLD